MIRVVTVVWQIMRELKVAASEKAKIMASINIVYNLLQEDDK
jgi:cell division protein ZapA (FtsZ GTPase activity inhibitor)